MKKFRCYEKALKSAEEIADKCIECGLCMKDCIMLNEFCTSPKELFKGISITKEVDEIIPYSCNMCDKCSMVCPKDLKIKDAFMDMRRDMADQNGGRSPVKGHRAIDMHQFLGFSKIFNTSIKDKRAGYTKRVFIPGCSLSSYSPELVEKVLMYLQERLPGTGAVLKCCGKPTRDMGQEEKFRERYDDLNREIDALGADEVITACQNCFITISENSPDKRVRSLWEVIPEIGLPEDIRGIGKTSDIVFSIHDACPTRNNKDIQDGVRWIVNELGYKYEESICSRENTNCCGFGGMTAPANPELSAKVMKKSASQSKEDYIITYCASCREAMTLGGKRSLHILDLMFKGPLNFDVKVQMKKGTAIRNWTNRYISKGKINRLR